MLVYSGSTKGNPEGDADVEGGANMEDDADDVDDSQKKLMEKEEKNAHNTEFVVVMIIDLPLSELSSAFATTKEATTEIYHNNDNTIVTFILLAAS